MSIESVLIVLLYSIQPYWWAVAILLVIPLLCYFAHSTTFFVPQGISVSIGLVCGVLVGLAAPYITGSGLEYVATVTDWVSLIAVVLGASFYVWLNLQILSRD